MSIEVLNESGLDLDLTALAALSRFVLVRMRVHPLAELCLKAVDEDTMAELNQQWMEKEGPTDVLAFPMDELRPGRRDDPTDDPGLLGDVVLCPEVASAQAKVAGHTTEEELHLLCTHGMLHLLGYDHFDADSEREMFAEQRRLLAGWRAAWTAG